MPAARGHVVEHDVDQHLQAQRVGGGAEPAQPRLVAQRTLDAGVVDRLVASPPLRAVQAELRRRDLDRAIALGGDRRQRRLAACEGPVEEMDDGVGLHRGTLGW